MINNSALGKWDRLGQKDLDHQFVKDMEEGLQASPFEAKAILDTVYRVYAPFFETSGSLKPGQILFQVIAVESSINLPLAQSKQVTVTLTVDAGQEDLEMRRTEGVIGLRRHRIQRVCDEAFQQGGLLTVEDLANRLFNCGERTLSRDLRAFRDQGILLPLRSVIKDMGRTLSHRSMIVKEWLMGKEYAEISRRTHHSVSSVRNYISKFKRTICLAEESYDIHTISFLVKLSPALVKEYYGLYQSLEIIPHRQAELREGMKKNRGAQSLPKRVQ